MDVPIDEMELNSRDSSPFEESPNSSLISRSGGSSPDLNDVKDVHVVVNEKSLIDDTGLKKRSILSVKENPKRKTKLKRSISGGSMCKTKHVHLYAVNTSEWSQEELNFLNDTEIESAHKSQVHNDISHRLSTKYKWLRFFTNLVVTMMGTSGVVKTMVDALSGSPDPLAIIFAFLTLLAGVLSSVGDAFNWQVRAGDHDLASDRFGEIATDIRVIRGTPGLDRRYCDLIVTRIANKLSETNTNAPWANYPPIEIADAP